MKAWQATGGKLTMSMFFVGALTWHAIRHGARQEILRWRHEGEQYPRPQGRETRVTVVGGPRRPRAPWARPSSAAKSYWPTASRPRILPRCVPGVGRPSLSRGAGRGGLYEAEAIIRVWPVKRIGEGLGGPSTTVAAGRGRPQGLSTHRIAFGAQEPVGWSPFPPWHLGVRVSGPPHHPWRQKRGDKRAIN
jgi:hypothetical protein